MESISRLDNRIIINGEFGIAHFHRLLATLYTAIEKLGYEDLVIDFSQCIAAFPGPMLAICSQVVEARDRGISVRLVLPVAAKLAKLSREE